MQVDRTSENSRGGNESHKIDLSMAKMSSNIESPRRYFGHSLKLIDYILDSGAMCHMTPQISDFVPGSLVETSEYIEVSDGH